jgi:hypothetical protein
MLQQMLDDHTEPSGTLPAVEPAPAASVIYNGGEKRAAWLTQDAANAKRPTTRRDDRGTDSIGCAFVLVLAPVVVRTAGLFS